MRLASFLLAASAMVAKANANTQTNCNEIDVQWIVDESASIADGEFEQQLKLVKGVSEQFLMNQDKTRMGWFGFASQLPHGEFDLPSVTDGTAFRASLDANAQIPEGFGATHTHEALERAKNKLVAYTTPTPTRPNVQGIVALLTDGNCWLHGGADSNPEPDCNEDARQAAMNLIALGYDLIYIPLDGTTHDGIPVRNLTMFSGIIPDSQVVDVNIDDALELTNAIAEVAVAISNIKRFVQCAGGNCIADPNWDVYQAGLQVVNNVAISRRKRVWKNAMETTSDIGSMTSGCCHHYTVEFEEFDKKNGAFAGLIPENIQFVDNIELGGSSGVFGADSYNAFTVNGAIQQFQRDHKKMTKVDLIWCPLEQTIRISVFDINGALYISEVFGAADGVQGGVHYQLVTSLKKDNAHGPMQYASSTVTVAECINCPFEPER